MRKLCGLGVALVLGCAAVSALGQGGPDGWQYCDGRCDGTVILLTASRMLDVQSGRVISPGVVVVKGDHIVAVPSSPQRIDPRVGRVIDLGDVTLMPGLIDAHVHLFLHPGAEDLQTVEESVPQRVLIAADAAKHDLMAGFTAERDMGSEGAGCADVAVRNAIKSGLIPGPRMRVSCNAVDLTGGHEDAIGYNPAQHVLSNADAADSAAELVKVIREQRKGGADFTKIYETGKDSYEGGMLKTPYQYTVDELKAAVAEAARVGGAGHGVSVHATGEPGTGYAVAAGVESVDHAYVLSDATMRAMKEKGIFAVPTFAISEYFVEQAATPEGKAKRREAEDLHLAEFNRQMAAGVPFAVGSDVGPFPHGTQAREMVLMGKYGMPAALMPW